jgi:peptidoglycan/xylan/chitin deacetylase (PgdA/CDA1 family)
MHLVTVSGIEDRHAVVPPARTPVAPLPGRWKRMKRGCLHALQAGLNATGLARLYVRARRVTGAVILSYHSVADALLAPWIEPDYLLDPGRFEKQMRFLARRRAPVSLSRLVESLAAGRDLPPRAVVVTLDDGYLDHLTVAGPILARHGIPATFFLPTGFVTRGENQWIDRVHSAFRRRTRHVLRLDEPGWDGIDVSRPPAARDASRALQPILMKTSLARRNALVEAIEEQLRPEGRMPRLIMNWDDVKELRKLSPDFEFGGHTRNHLDLGSSGPDVVASEIAECASDLRAELGDAPRSFCFPYERWNAAAKEEVRKRGFTSAMGAGDEYLVTHRSDRFALPRIEAPLLRATFGFATSGAYPGLSKALTGRA